MKQSRHERRGEHHQWWVGVFFICTVIGGCYSATNQVANESGSTTQPVAPRQSESKSGPSETQSETKQSGTGQQVAKSSPVAEKTIALTVGNEATLDQWIKDNRGKVILIDFWATWCAPCVSQFPHTVKLSQEHREQGLAVVSVSMDEPDSEQQVLEFLQKHHANFANLLTPYGAGSKFPEAFEMCGDVPFYKLYDRQGQLRYVFSDQPDGLENGEVIAQIDRRVAELLAEKVQ